MKWLLGRKDRKAVGSIGQTWGRNLARARVEVESLEARALLAANFSLADTLNAKDNLDLERLTIKQSIEQLRIDNVNQLGTVITDGQSATQAIAADYSATLQALAADRAAGDAQAVAADKYELHQDLVYGREIRNYMRIATASSNTTQATLLSGETKVDKTFAVYVGQLQRNYDPTTVTNNGYTAIDYVGTQAEKHATAGEGSLLALDNLILAVPVPGTNDGG